MRSQVKAVCSHCYAKCGVLVDLADGEPVKVAGDPTHPVSKGFICVRGQAAIEYFHHPDRLNHVLKRVGARGENRWAKIGWDEALDEIAEKLKRLIGQFGPETLTYFFGTYHGPDQGAGIRFMNLIGSPNYAGNAFICAGPQLEAEWTTFGFAPTAPNPQAGVTRSILMWGQRLSASNAPQWGSYLAAKRGGAKLVVIDPIRTPEARVADIWLPVRQNTDAALALGLLNVVIEERLYREDLVKEMVGFSDLAERVGEFTPSRVAEITGVDADVIRQVARIFADGPSIMSSGLTNGMGRNAISFERAKCCLIAITGNLDRPGANLMPGPPDRVLSKTDLELYDRLPLAQRSKRLGGDRFRLLVEGYERINEAARRRWPSHRYPLTASRGAIAHAPTIFRTVLEERPYPLRAMIVQHANIVGAYPNVDLARRALLSKNLDLLVVHELFMTATASYADYVIPAAAWLEKSFMYVSGDNKMILGAGCAVAPKHDRRSDYSFFRDLAVRFGQSEMWPNTLDDVWDAMLAPVNLRFQELATRQENWFIDEVSGTPAKSGFGTPSGEIELRSSILAECGYDPLPNYDESKAEGDPAEYPLTLMTGATDINLTHQDHRQIASLRKRHPHPTTRINPKLAERLGFKTGDWVWVEAPLGRVRQRVEVSEFVPMDTVDAERWWYPEWPSKAPTTFGVMESNVNVLAIDDPELCDEAYGTWPYRFGRCRLVAASAPESIVQSREECRPLVDPHPS